MVAFSTTEAEYMVATHACKEAIWLKRLCSDVGVDAGQITICCDSQSAICLAKNPTFHARTKHIDVQFHFVRDMVEDGKVNLEKVDTAKNVADSLTKPVSTKKFRWCSESMGLLAYSNQFLLCSCCSYKVFDKWENVRNNVSQPCTIPVLIICFVNVIFANNVI